jgi:hypothetical protein
VKTLIYIIAAVLFTWLILSGCTSPTTIERVTIIEKVDPNTYDSSLYRVEIVQSSVDGCEYVVHMIYDPMEVTVNRRNGGIVRVR